MYNRVYDFWTENDILYEKKFGFQFAHSTEHAALQLPNQFSNSFNEKQFTLRVFIEFPKTFDTVDHKILITKLEKYWNKTSIHRLI